MHFDIIFDKSSPKSHNSHYSQQDFYDYNKNTVMKYRFLK